MEGLTPERLIAVKSRIKNEQIKVVVRHSKKYNKYAAWIKTNDLEKPVNLIKSNYVYDSPEHAKFSMNQVIDVIDKMEYKSKDSPIPVQDLFKITVHLKSL